MTSFNYFSTTTGTSSTSMAFDGDDDYWSEGEVDDSEIRVHIDDDAAEWGFPDLAALTSALSIIQYNEDENEVAYFCLGVGIKHAMDYGSSSSAFTWNAALIFTDDFLYGSAIACYNWEDTRDEVIDNIKRGLPVQIGVSQTGKKGGHSVVIDGYDDDTGEFHVNMGWGGTADNWYDLPSIDTRQYRKDGTRIVYDTIHTVVYEICPDGAWCQCGADERNTFRAIYPVTVPLP